MNVRLRVRQAEGLVMSVRVQGLRGARARVLLGVLALDPPEEVLRRDPALLFDRRRWKKHKLLQVGGFLRYCR